LEQLDFIDSKFRLALLAARRAKQLVAGSKKKLEVNAENPLTIAMQEIYQGKVNFEILDEEQMEKLKEFEESQFIETEEEIEDEVEDFLFEGRDKDESDSQEEAG
jgi:DNA-directed RNA polymerase subunit omega